MKQKYLIILGLMVATGFMGFICGGLTVWWFMWQSQQPPMASYEQLARQQIEQAGQSPGPSQSPPDNRAAPPHSVIVNGQRISDQNLQFLAQQYQVRITPGNYWYDRVSGGWGYVGGPGAGVIMAGLNLGGQLRPDVSNGDTGVFINGRELPAQDLQKLQLLIPVQRGRFWMDAQSNFGQEDGPALVNLVQLLQAAIQAQGGGGGGGGSVRREGILSTYDKTGVAVFGY